MKGKTLWMKNKIAIAIDGPAAAGKSTVAKIVANKLSYTYIDTGAMYRALTLKAYHNSIPFDDEAGIAKLLESTEIILKQTNQEQIVELDGKDVSREIRTQIVTNNVSYIAKHQLVRMEMVKRQQHLSEEGGVVMDGRDIGTHVLPDAELKIFLIASVDERAKRRHEENINKGFESDLVELKKEIKQRDLIDSEREIAPLVKADDAIEIDTTSLTIDKVAELILNKAKHKIN